MSYALHHPIPERRRRLYNATASALWTAGALITVVVAAAVLFFWVFATRAS